MAELKSIRLRGWKSIREVDLQLESVNVLIGANGSGKSNFISFFKLLSTIPESRVQPLIATSGGANSVLHYGAKETSELEAALVVRAPLGEIQYSARLADAPPDTVVFVEETIR